MFEDIDKFKKKNTKEIVKKETTKENKEETDGLTDELTDFVNSFNSTMPTTPNYDLKVDTVRHTTKNALQLSESQTSVLKCMLYWANPVKYSHFKDYYKSKLDYENETIFSLSGYAGTGKTTLINEFLNLCGIPKFKIFVSAPTHKAKKVIESITGVKGYTVQKLLGLRPNTNIDEFDIDNILFDNLGEELIDEASLVICDEASMINKDLNEYIRNKAATNGTKVVFVGDEYQLPPVNEKYSTTFQNSTFFRLTEIIRQSNTNPLNDLIACLRDDIKNETKTWIDFITENPVHVNDKGEGYEILNEEDFKDTLSKYFSSEYYKSDTNYAKFTAWTNEKIGIYNTIIRKFVHSSISNIEELPLVNNEVLIGYKTITNSVSNSEEYILESFSKLNDYNNIDVYDVVLESVDRPYRFSVRIVDPKNTYNFIGEHRRYHNDAKKYRKWKSYFDFKDNYLVLGGIKDKYVIIPKDLDYGYGLTVHKTQGSTYQNMFVDVKDILKNRDIRERTQLLYVAVSRASKKVYLHARKG